MPITPEFVSSLEDNIRQISTREYQRLNANTWWRNIMKPMPVKTRRERVTWLLDTAQIERPNAASGGGQAVFDDLVSLYEEYEPEYAIAGLRLTEAKLTDLENGIPGGEGLRIAANWSRQVGEYAAYFPQKELANLIKANPVSYTGQTFFNLAHPVNPFKPAAGTYANLIENKPIHKEAVTVEEAVENLSDVIAAIAEIPMPNGEDPRGLEVAEIYVPAKMYSRAIQVTQAQYIAQAASSGGGSGDVAAVISNFGFGMPVKVTELSAAYGGSDTDYYISVRGTISDELGAFVWVDREPFSITYHNKMTDAQLARHDELQWKIKGRNLAAPGHPYLFFKVTGQP